MAKYGISISESAFKGASGALFALAIIGAAALTSIRFRPVPRITLDDSLLFFACICLAASTGLLFELIPQAYVLQKLDLGYLDQMPFPVKDLPGELSHMMRILGAYTFLSWAVIYASKFSYLVFFRALVDRLWRMVIYWRVVVVITLLLGGVSLCETFLACPHVDAASVRCLRGSGFHKTFAVSVMLKCFDIFTDILLISIPITLLWDVHIAIRQKLGIGAFLCLSIVMIIIALIKIAGIFTSVHSFGLIWELFWQHIEACAAVLMVSLTAFRPVFVSKKPKAQRKTSPVIYLKRIPTLLCTNKTSEGGDQILILETPADSHPPLVTLYAPYQSARHKDPEKADPESIDSDTLYSHDLEDGLQGKATDCSKSED